ncbi:hypothetical protein HPB47_015695 [Ixodes persulcatus]|uniref:Uncharacterized protein n=1 Tax=Ixodes persulcatus TaxID=34615 RepID=A0AC60QVD5_IXOPE|nr:hypothetical protein HPB47_015695 [Ixodes persulcatus]
MVNSGAKATPVHVLQAIGCIGPSVVNFYARNFAKMCKDVGVCVFGGDDSSIGGDVSCAWLSDNLWDGLRPVQQFIMSCSSIENMRISHCLSGKTALRLTYNAYSDAKTVAAIGNLLVNVCRLVKLSEAGSCGGGVLCFFPSYQAMSKCIEFWKTTLDDIWKSLRHETNGCVYVEGNNPTSEYIESVAYGEVSLLCAVHRGRISEGMDFSDNLARAVVSIGIPFPSTQHDDIKLKMKFNDEHQPQLLNGRDWYQIQAMRAINQAVGRCIRHSNDWGAILLVDHRFTQNDIWSGMSDWIKIIEKKRSVTEAECKRRWRLIRDRYVKESKGTKGKSGAGREDVTQPTWVLYKFLGFLDGQIHRRKIVTTSSPRLHTRRLRSLLVNLEERGETPNAAQLTPPLEGPAASHEDLLPQAGRSSQANGAAPAATKRPASPEGPRPPAPKRRARSSAQHIRTREESELLRVLGQTSKSLAAEPDTRRLRSQQST